MTDFRAELQALYNEVTGTRFDAMARLAVLDRARAALSQPEPEGPTLAELDDLCEEHCFNCEDRESLECLLSVITDALARWGRPALQPVPVSERWPEFSDCDDADQVWCWSWAIGTWRLSRINQLIHSHWLPAHALPLPTRSENV